MEKLLVRCPHCRESFDLHTAMTPKLRTSLIEHLEIAALQRSRIREEIVAELAQAHRLQALEQEKLISDLRASIQELQMKATRGSQQRAGEVLEIEVFNCFKPRFPQDDWTRNGKGRNSADILQRVRDRQGCDAGRILWEIKNTASWTSKWIGKIRADALRSQAVLCVIVTATLPKDLQNFGELDGVWIANLGCYMGLALALRSQLLTCAALREELRVEGRAHQLRDYVTSPEFKRRVNAIAFAATSINAQVEREKQFLTRHWAERQKFAASINDSLSAICIGIQAVSQGHCESVNDQVLLLDDEVPRTKADFSADA